MKTKHVFVLLSYENAIILHYLLQNTAVHEQMTAHEQVHALASFSAIAAGIERYRASERRARA